MRFPDFNATWPTSAASSVVGVSCQLVSDIEYEFTLEADLVSLVRRYILPNVLWQWPSIAVIITSLVFKIKFWIQFANVRRGAIMFRRSQRAYWTRENNGIFWGGRWVSHVDSKYLRKTQLTKHVEELHLLSTSYLWQVTPVP